MTGATERGEETVETALRQRLGRLDVATAGTGFTDITAALDRWLADGSAGDGLLTVLIRHTSASLTIQENADPDVLRDLGDALSGLAPEEARYRHSLEGPDDMPAHIKSALTDASLSIPVRGGRLDLGTWQGIYVVEHRTRPHRRSLSLHFLGALLS
ncbi:MAG: secondary thiamine-phosphate synthase enzyme YjbQ [Hyphomicrobiales bacterium]|nr:secondary thiamine-phosphate synthase enzyme YjbQ [Hyphomicrobiales bacterium]